MTEQAMVEQDRIDKLNQAGSLRSDRELEADGTEDYNNVAQLYEDFVKQYKETHPDFDEKKNFIEYDKEKGVICLKFDNPEAEEAFVRKLAQNQPTGSVFDKGIQIASFQDGKLIDPRTQKEFGEGEYANLVKQLDKGVKYEKIQLPEQTTLNRPQESMPQRDVRAWAMAKKAEEHFKVKDDNPVQDSKLLEKANKIAEKFNKEADKLVQERLESQKKQKGYSKHPQMTSSSTDSNTPNRIQDKISSSASAASLQTPKPLESSSSQEEENQKKTNPSPTLGRKDE